MFGEPDNEPLSPFAEAFDYISDWLQECDRSELRTRKWLRPDGSLDLKQMTSDALDEVGLSDLGVALSPEAEALMMAEVRRASEHWIDLQKTNPTPDKWEEE
jgi:hypothetical protein